MPESLTVLPSDLEPSDRGSLQGHGGLRLAFARWEHPDPVGRVVISHGYGEHGERYRHTAKWLHSLGWSVSSMDHAGFGKSGGTRGDARGIRPFADDLALFLRQERLHDASRLGAHPRLVDDVPVLSPPVLPQVVLGHSFGGLVAMLACLWHPDSMDGLILSSPAVSLRPRAGLMKLVGSVLFRLGPHLSIDLPGNKNLVCSDPVLVQRYWADPYCHRRVTASFPAAIQAGREELLAFGSGLDRPILLLQAGTDTVVDPDGAEAIWSSIKPGLLERHRLAGFYHEVFHDIHRAEAQALVEPWLEGRRRTWTADNASMSLEPVSGPLPPAIAV
ncbi:MAG: alpha/beta hydrolase [Holophagaceae bacterium]|nr:alpha/beta hydrolase [Holophagaceae bacterium]